MDTNPDASIPPWFVSASRMGRASAMAGNMTTGDIVPRLMQINGPPSAPMMDVLGQGRMITSAPDLGGDNALSRTALGQDGFFAKRSPRAGLYGLGDPRVTKNLLCIEIPGARWRHKGQILFMFREDTNTKNINNRIFDIIPSDTITLSHTIIPLQLLNREYNPHTRFITSVNGTSDLAKRYEPFFNAGDNDLFDRKSDKNFTPEKLVKKWFPVGSYLSLEQGDAQWEYVTSQHMAPQNIGVVVHGTDEVVDYWHSLNVREGTRLFFIVHEYWTMIKTDASFIDPKSEVLLPQKGIRITPFADHKYSHPRQYPEFGKYFEDPQKITTKFSFTYDENNRALANSGNRTFTLRKFSRSKAIIISVGFCQVPSNSRLGTSSVPFNWNGKPEIVNDSPAEAFPGASNGSMALDVFDTYNRNFRDYTSQRSFRIFFDIRGDRVIPRNKLRLRAGVTKK